MVEVPGHVLLIAEHVPPGPNLCSPLTWTLAYSGCQVQLVHIGLTLLSSAKVIYPKPSSGCPPQNTQSHCQAAHLAAQASTRSGNSPCAWKAGTSPGTNLLTALALKLAFLSCIPAVATPGASCLLMPLLSMMSVCSRPIQRGHSLTQQDQVYCQACSVRAQCCACQADNVQQLAPDPQVCA